MNAPTTAPVLPLGADTIAVMRSNAAKIATWDSERATVLVYGDRPRREVQLALDVQALCDALTAADAAGAERGRAEALAEVDAACARIVKDKHGVGVDGMVALYGFQRGDDGPTEWGEALCEVGEPTPTAALFVAAAAATAAALTPDGAS